jgi:hypothetical protein
MRQLCESIRAREARIVSRNVDWEILRLNSERARPTHKKNWHDEEEVDGGARVRPKTAAINRGAPQGESLNSRLYRRKTDNQIETYHE